MKKILIITYTHSNGGGAENVLTTFVNNLNTSEYEATIQEIDFFGRKKEQLNENVHLKKTPLCNTTKKDTFATLNRFFLSNNPNVLKSVFNWYGFDIVMSWNYQLPSFALLSFSEEYKISHFHGDVYDLDINRFPEQKNNYELQVKVWENADRITTISNKSKESIEDICPQFRDKVSFIHNSVDIDNIIKKSNQEIEKNVAFSKDSFKLISLGRLDTNKNYTLVLKALAILVRKGLNVELYLLGNGELENELRQECKELKLTDHVHFLGYITNPYPYIKNCDLLCISSFSEGWSMTACEAMALGKPFLTTPVAGASEELSNNEECGLVSDWSPKEYSRRIEELYYDKDLLRKLGENGKRNVQKYSISATQLEFKEVIKDKAFQPSKLSVIDLFNIGKYVLFYSSGAFALITRYKYGNRKEVIYWIKVIVSIFGIPLLFIPRMMKAILYCINAKE